MTNTSFSSLPLLPALLDNLQGLGFEQMTPIQAQSLPLILEGRDLIAQAKTGSGKTAAFGLGVLQNLDVNRLAPQALVLCPTRELADQVAQELRRLARLIPNVKVLTLCGGAAARPQAESLARGSLDLSTLNTLVLDEADRMVDMGFYDDIAAIASHCPARRQTLLFSATYPDNIRKLSARFLRNPAEIKVEAQHDASRIEQLFFEIDEGQRLDAVAALLAHFRPASTLAFCNTKIRSHDLVERLRAQGISAQALNGDLEQRERDEILIQFANQSCAVLVATDVAARGLDIQNLGAVINVDVTKDTEVHVHRIGRSGRGDQKGLALSLCSPEEMRWANLIEQYQGAPLKWADLGSLRPKSDRPLRAPMITLCIQGGKKDKLRPGDLLGALTGDGGLAFEQVGKINITEFNAYVALDRQVAKQAFARLSNSNIKGRRFRMRFLEEF
ncbi:ATP-dependent RNA helicase DbpA [Bordetella bronchiseptica]|uniref:ATP-dependent RNA helicase DbpA n=1 Tax=Bordetella bronchiseptica TaxID=518 RepID=UPI0039FD7A21